MTRSVSSPAVRWQARQARRQDSTSSFEREFVACMSPSDGVDLVSDTLSSLSSAPVIDGDMNSCGSVHGCSGGVVHVNS